MKKNKHTSLITLSPIEYRPDDPENRLATIRKALETESKLNPENQVLGKCPMVHMARVQIIDDVIPAMGQRPPDTLKSKYLLLVADIDGEVEDFFDALYNGPQYPFDWIEEAKARKRHSDFVHNVWGQCIAYPKDRGCIFFRRFMQRCRIRVSLPFAAYDFTVDEIKEAKEKQAAFAKFVEDTQSMGPEKLFVAWKAYRQGHEHSTTTGHLVIKKSGLLKKGHAMPGDEPARIPVPRKDPRGRPHADGRY